MQDDTPYQKHTHSDAEYLLLSQISTASFLLVFFMAVLGLWGSKSQLLLSYVAQNHVKDLGLSSHRLRGPPHYSI